MHLLMEQRGGRPRLSVKEQQREAQRRNRWARESKLKAEMRSTSTQSSAMLSPHGELTTAQAREDVLQQPVEKNPRVASHPLFMLISHVPAMD